MRSKTQTPSCGMGTSGLPRLTFRGVCMYYLFPVFREARLVAGLHAYLFLTCGEVDLRSFQMLIYHLKSLKAGNGSLLLLPVYFSSPEKQWRFVGSSWCPYLLSPFTKFLSQQSTFAIFSVDKSNSARFLSTTITIIEGFYTLKCAFLVCMARPMPS